MELWIMSFWRGVKLQSMINVDRQTLGGQGISSSSNLKGGRYE